MPEIVDIEAPGQPNACTDCVLTVYPRDKEYPAGYVGPRWQEGNIVEALPAMMRHGLVCRHPGRKPFHVNGRDDEIGWLESLSPGTARDFLTIYKVGRTAESYYAAGMVGRGRAVVAFQKHYGGVALAAVRDLVSSVGIQVNHPVCLEEPTPGPMFGRVITGLIG